MQIKISSAIPFTGIMILLFFLGSPGLASEPQARMEKQAQLAARGPMKLGVKPLAKAYRMGDRVELQITLLNAYDQPAAASARIEVMVETVSPPNKKNTATVNFQPGESVQTFKFIATEEGVIRITVRDKGNQMREGYFAVLVSKPIASPKPVKKRFYGPNEISYSSLRWSDAEEYPSAVLPVAFLPDPRDEGSGTPNQPSPAEPKLLFHVPGAQDSGGGAEFLADDRDGAQVLVFYMSQDGSAAPTDIHVWLTWSNGELNPQPLLIRKGESFGEAKLRSRWPAEARIEFVLSSPPYPLEGTRRYTVKFGPPIYGINVVGSQRLSLVDNGMLLAALFDNDGNPVQTDTKRTVTFTPISPKLRLLPTQADILPGSFSTTAAILPVGLGHAQLSVSTPGYKSVTVEVDVTGLSVILLCLAGGIAGGFCAFNAFKGSLLWRIFLGVIGGAVLSWLYVYLALPKVDSRIAHNLVSVLFVSIIGGYLGIQALDLAAKQLGIVLGNPSKE
ncbi:MAG: hypothetical protein ABSH28_15990 [Acidobacteriota bacterium]